MSDLENEKCYLENAIRLAKYQLDRENEKLVQCKESLIEARKEMWENTAHHSQDFEKLTEMNQHQQIVLSRTVDYDIVKKNVEKYLTMMEVPYFGRFDFIEDGYDEQEKIYIGKYSLIDSKNSDIIVYDWRAPISGMFYRFEPGKASYVAPFEEITGEISLKRQYKILKGHLQYYFDCSMQINDEILQEVLSRNSSPKMRDIVETIQKEQDIIIRDTESDLLIVQGVAGSGKTSIALHRIAFLLYEGMTSKLAANNILIISPNNMFESYINHVLPELGEENVVQNTMEETVKNCFKGLEKCTVQIPDFHGRNEQIEACMLGSNDFCGSKITKWVEFKGSKTFKIILDRYLKLYERHILKFVDVYYSNILIANRADIKNDFLNNKLGIPMAKRLQRIESRLLESIKDLRKERLRRIEELVKKSDGHEFQIKSFSRLLLMKHNRVFTQSLKSFTSVDVFSIYERLFLDPKLFYKLSKGLQLPDDVQEIIKHTYEASKKKYYYYEDLTAIAYIKLKIFGAKGASDIRQVVIDEVQDYYPIQLAILKELYEDARFTVVGDIAQSIERSASISIYDEIPQVLKKTKTVKLLLNRSYRCSYEINEFAKRIQGGMPDCVSFPRSEEEPEILCGETEEMLQKLALNNIERYIGEGFETMSILCKNMSQASELYKQLKNKVDITLICDSEQEIRKGLFIMPVYMAKGLEFDAVLIYGVDDDNYYTELDRRLLYIACTRGLHRLSLYYKRVKSRFLS